MASKFPLAVEIEINSDCNMACPYCPNSKAERVEKGRMDKSLFTEVLNQLKSINYNGRISYHFYNEPTLSPDLEEFVALTKQYLPDARIDLFSNATLLDKKKIDTLVEKGVDKFSLTKHFRADTKSFESALEEVSPENKNLIRYQTYKDIVLTNRGGSLNIKNKNLTAPLKLPCFIPQCALVVTVKGNVVPCYEDYFQKHVMGNVKEMHLVDIWNSDNYVNYRKKLSQGQRAEFDVCKDCNNSWVIS